MTLNSQFTTDKPVALRFWIELEYDAESRNRTWATLVGGECSQHCSPSEPATLWIPWVFVIFRNTAVITPQRVEYFVISDTLAFATHFPLKNMETALFFIV